MNKFKFLGFLLLFISIFNLTYAASYDFEIEIDHDFDSDEEIECVLDYGPIRTYTFDEDSDRDDLLIENDFDESIEFECDNELDTIDFIVYDEDGDEFVDDRYDDVDYFFYEILEYDINIEINHDFDDDTIVCTYSIDGSDDEELILNDSSSSSDLEIEETFLETFEFDCDDDLEELEIKIENSNGYDVFDMDLKDLDEFNYDIDKQIPMFYEFNLQIYEDFDEDTECSLSIDGDYDIDYEFDDDERLSDLKIEVNFGDYMDLDCDSDINYAYLEIINNSLNLDIEIFNDSFGDVSSYRFELSDFEPILEEDEDIEEEEDVREVVDLSNNDDAEDNNENEEDVVAQDESDSIISNNVDSQEQGDITLGLGSTQNNISINSSLEDLNESIDDVSNTNSFSLDLGISKILILFIGFLTLVFFIYGISLIFS